SRRGQWPAPWARLAGRVPLRACDLGDQAALEAVLRDVQPERIFHLAGYPHVGRSFQEPDEAWAGHLTATRHLYQAVGRGGGRPRILFIGGGLVYGDSAALAQAPDERCLLCPNSPYAASKAAADLVSYQYGCNPGLEIVRARPFNHIGPGQQPQFAI